MNNKSSGVTLIELILAIVVIGIGLAALLTLINNVTRQSADPVIQQQAYAVGQSYMEEILSQPFCDPNDFSIDCHNACTASACSSCSGSTTPGGAAETRSSFDDVCDYNSITNEATSDMNGPVASLSDYSVSVTVDDSGVNFNGLDSNSGQVVRIDVDVTHKNGFTTSLSAYKANF